MSQNSISSDTNSRHIQFPSFDHSVVNIGSQFGASTVYNVPSAIDDEYLVQATHLVSAVSHVTARGSYRDDSWTKIQRPRRPEKETYDDKPPWHNIAAYQQSQQAASEQSNSQVRHTDQDVSIHAHGGSHHGIGQARLA